MHGIKIHVIFSIDVYDILFLLLGKGLFLLFLLIINIYIYIYIYIYIIIYIYLTCFKEAYIGYHKINVVCKP